jgi:hypothetical protein
MPRDNSGLVLTFRALQIIYGSLLGDGSLNIYDKYKNARFQEKHGENQFDYMQWKVHELSDVCSAKAISDYVDDSSYSPTRHFQTRACSCLTEIHKVVNHQVDVVQPDGTVVKTNEIFCFQVG